MIDKQLEKYIKEEFREFAIGELLTALVKGDEERVKQLAKEANMTAVIEADRDQGNHDTIQTIIKILDESRYALIAEKVTQREGAKGFLRRRVILHDPFEL